MQKRNVQPLASVHRFIPGLMYGEIKKLLPLRTKRGQLVHFPSQNLPCFWKASAVPLRNQAEGGWGEVSGPSGPLKLDPESTQARGIRQERNARAAASPATENLASPATSSSRAARAWRLKPLQKPQLGKRRNPEPAL